METVRVGADEANRLEILESLDLLDTKPEERFDRIVSQARRVFEVPVAFISLLDSVRQWFKSAEGLDIENLSREVSFCDYVIKTNRPLIVEDLSQDPVLKSNPLVVSTPRVRFYAGYPLRVKGQPVGTVAILGVVPRVFDERDQLMLESLVCWAESELQRDKLGALNQLLDTHRARYLTLFAESPMAIQVHNLDGVMVEKNDGAAFLWSVLERDLDDLVTMSPFPTVDFSALFRAAALGEPQTVEPFSYDTPSGRRTYLRAKLQPLSYGGRVQQVVISLEDITDTCALEENQRKLLLRGQEREQRLKKARQDQETFYTILSHELRNPLMGILGISEMLQRDPASLTAELAHSLHSCAETLSGLIDDTLDIERISQGRLKLETEPFSPYVLLESLLSAHAPSASLKGLALTHSCAEEIDHVLGDRRRISQILSNLISNAVKYTAKGRIHIDLRRQDGGLLLSVADTGQGIEPDRLEAVFQPFFQVQAEAADSRRGLGIGLSIVKNLTDLMGGTVSVSSVRGEGSTFSVSLPLAPAAPAVSEPADEPRLSSQVLVVDDNPVNQKILSLQLQSMGCTAAVASDGVEALELLRKRRFDLVLMDCHMPRKDGFETACDIRDHPELYGTPAIVALTASATGEARQKCLDSGMQDYLKKPIRHQELRQALTRNLLASQGKLE